MVDRHRNERGMAMLAAIIIMVLASFIAVAIIMSAMSSVDGVRYKQDDAATQEIARTASVALASAYSTLASGEHDGFVPNQATLVSYATKAGGTVVPNSSLGQLGKVDNARIPAYGQFTVRQPASNGKTGYWQLFSVKLPQWGTTKAGHVIVYIRAWTVSAANVASKPAIYRAEFRPGWFADYQLLVDGPFGVGNGATVDGRMHSNGYKTSFYNQYETWNNDSIRFDPLATCTASARITTSVGAIQAPQCANVKAGTTPRINILRARDLANSLRHICQSLPHPSVQMVCPPTTLPVDVTLLPTGFVAVKGPGINTQISGNVGPKGLPSSNQGAVVVLAGNATLHGSLPVGARALLVTASSLTTPTSVNYGTGTAPSVTVTKPDNVGSSAVPNDKTSSFGVVAEGDVVFDEKLDCGTNGFHFRGAIVTMTGMVSANPIWRSPFYTPGGFLCPMSKPAVLEGSITGHLPPTMATGNNSGYGTRKYQYLHSLYDNPPPLYPTASDWEVTNFAQADLDCFAASGGIYTLDLSKAACI